MSRMPRGPSCMKKYGRIVLTSSTSGIFGNFGQANYGAAKMGMVGMMNVLALEGASKNVRVNTLAPAAATRLTNTIRDETRIYRALTPLAPDLVTPAVLYMCAEDAPNGKIIKQATADSVPPQSLVMMASIRARMPPMNLSWTTSNHHGPKHCRGSWAFRRKQKSPLKRMLR